MILADKIIAQRKKSGWSQEELAEKMGVTRQSVSKWEGAQSTPDLEKLLELGRLFGVSTDYLLKDEMEDAEYLSDEPQQSGVRRVSLQEATEFLRIKSVTARRVAFATVLCILSPVCLLLLGAASQKTDAAFSENMAGGIGLTILLLLVTAAVAVFISCGSMTAPYEYLEKEIFETEYGVTGMVKERQKQYRQAYTRANVMGVCLCILSVIPLFAGQMVSENDLVLCGTLAITLALAAVGVWLFISAGINWASLEKLLQQGDYTRGKKKRGSLTRGISTAFWLLAVAIFLGYSFVSEDWQHSWIIWPVAGVLYAAVAVVCDALNGEG